MTFKVDILGIKEIEEKLDKLPIEVADYAIGDVQDYLLNVLRSDQPTPKYVSRRAAYGVPFFTAKQRRWFFAALKSGALQIPYRRTQTMSRSWRIEDRGLVGYIKNEAPGVGYVVGDKTQSRHEKMVGWKTVGQQVEERAEKIGKIIDAAVKKATKKMGL